MALTYLIRNDDLGDQYEWSIGESIEHMNDLGHRCGWLHANGEELDIIKNQFINIPFINDREELWWFGDIAAFIATNMKNVPPKIEKYTKREDRAKDQIYPFENPVRKLPSHIDRLEIGRRYITTSGRTVIFTKTLGTIIHKGIPAIFMTDDDEIFAVNGFNVSNHGDNVVDEITSG